MIDRVRISQLCREGKLDALLLTRTGNLRYAFGFVPPSARRQTGLVWAVVPADASQPIAMVLPESDLSSIALASLSPNHEQPSGVAGQDFVRQSVSSEAFTGFARSGGRPALRSADVGAPISPSVVRTYGKDAYLVVAGEGKLSDFRQATRDLVLSTRQTRQPSPLAATSALLGRLGMVPGRVAVDDYVLGLDLRHGWLARLEVVDGQDALWRLRSVKSADELVAMRKAADANAVAIRSALAIVEPGRCWREVADAWRRDFVDSGGQEVMLTMGGGDLGAGLLVDPGQKVARHDVVTLHGAGALGDYWSELARTAFVGELLPKPVRVVRGLAEGMEAAQAACRAGASLGDVAAAAEAALDDAGLKGASIEPLNGVGLDLVELPHGDEAMNVSLEVGMTIRIGLAYRELSWAGVMFVEVVEVTPNGGFPLSDLSLELVSTRG